MRAETHFFGPWLSSSICGSRGLHALGKSSQTCAAIAAGKHVSSFFPDKKSFPPGRPRMLAVLVFALALNAAEAVDPIPGSPLTGTLRPDGFLRFLVWPNANGVDVATYQQWCAQRRVGDDSTGLVAVRTNRCLSTNLGPGSSIVGVLVAPGSTVRLFMHIQANDTHFNTAMCPDNTCSTGCTHSDLAIPNCFESSLANAAGVALKMVVSPAWQPDAPVLPSPLFCFRLLTMLDCSGGEVLVSGCVAQCMPIEAGGFTHAACTTTPNGRVIQLTQCQYTDSLSALLAYAQCTNAATTSCPGPAPSFVPQSGSECTPVRNGIYGFQTVSCTVTPDKTLQSHACAGIADLVGAICNATDDQDVSVDGRLSNQVEGSWVGPTKRLQIRDPHAGVVPFKMRGEWVPNGGALQLQFDRAASISLGTPIQLASFSSVATNRAFSSVSVAASDSSETFCAAPDFQPTTMSVTITQGQCADGKLSTAAIAGAAVGGFVLVSRRLFLFLLSHVSISWRLLPWPLLGPRFTSAETRDSCRSSTAWATLDRTSTLECKSTSMSFYWQSPLPCNTANVRNIDSEPTAVIIDDSSTNRAAAIRNGQARFWACLGALLLASRPLLKSFVAPGAAELFAPRFFFPRLVCEWLIGLQA